jgi:hypothetical protein
MKTIQNPRETRNCSARLGLQQPGSKRRRIVRCGVPALDFGDVKIAGELVEIALCRAHFRTLRDSRDPLALKAFWAPEPPAS